MIRIMPRALVLLGLAFSFPVLAPRSGPCADAAPVSTATTLTRVEKIRRIEALDAARRHALAGIYDERLYPEADHGRSGQPEIDRRVNRVKALFAPLDQLLEAEAVRLAHEPAAKRNAFLARKDARLDAWSRAVKRRYLDRRIDRANAATEHAASLPPHGLAPTALEVEQVHVTNLYRMLMGRAALRIDTRLVRSARDHTDEMIALHYFAHVSPVARNRTLVDRFANVGLSPGLMGENIAWGNDLTPEATQQAFYDSAGHHRNLLLADWLWMGAGRGTTNDPKYGLLEYWTQDFASR